LGQTSAVTFVCRDPYKKKNMWPYNEYENDLLSTRNKPTREDKTPLYVAIVGIVISSLLILGILFSIESFF